MLPPPGAHYAGGRAYKKGGRVKREAGGASGGQSNGEPQAADLYDKKDLATKETMDNRPAAPIEKPMNVRPVGRTGRESVDRNGKVSGFKKGGKVFSGTPNKQPFTNKGKTVVSDASQGATPLQSAGTNKMDTKNIGRGPVITKATGGPIYSQAKGQMAPHAKGGAMGGLAKLDKANHPSKYVRA